MIWTITLWLAMQGQVDNACTQTPPSLCFYKGCEKMAAEIDGGCPVYTDAPTQFKPLKPAEHVFEIRTTRNKVKGSVRDNDDVHGPTIECPDGFDNPQGHRLKNGKWEWDYCYNVTRELWLDGKRLGIIKGLD